MMCPRSKGVAPRQTISREPEEPVPHRRSGRQRRSSAKFKFYKQHGYNMVKGVYSMMILNLQLSGMSQDLQYIHALLSDPEFVLMDNIMPQMMGKLSRIISLSKGYPNIPPLTEEMTGPYKSEFMQTMTHNIK